MIGGTLYIYNCANYADVKEINKFTFETPTLINNLSIKNENRDYSEIVNEKNEYIMTGGQGENINTVGWANWIIGEDGFPTLNLKQTWNGENWASE